ncbi:MAG: peptidase PmbA [Methanosaeta sp. PtaU1.Bin060]|jgi:PmbA protein|nr:MAG: peptidase PmbA [Methanosaeta sp. PtaU1.Bin060]
MRISGTSDSLIENAHRLLALAEREGAEEAEVFGICGRSADVDLRRDSVELVSESFHCGLGLRAVLKGAVGFSSTSDMKLLESVAASAVKTARARGSDEEWRSLPLPEKITRPEGIFDRRLARIGPEECLDLAQGLLQGCTQVSGAKPVSGGVACMCGTEFVVNSRGIELQETSTLMHSSLDAIAKGSDVATGSEFQNSRSLQQDLSDVGRAAAEMALASLGGAKAESGTFDVLLRPLAFAELMEYTLLPSLSAESIQKGRSALKGRIGERIASDGFKILDDGLLSGGMDSSSFDGEGVPSRRTALIEDGVLVGFLYDSYTAGKAGLSSTGNAVRSGYSEAPRVGIRNLMVSSPESHDLLAETKGFLVSGLIGAHTANSISGDFSVEARNAFCVVPGEEPKPLRSLMLAGNIFELLKDVVVGTDVRAVGAILTPTVRMKMKAVGS